jgi:hypothetical protein
MTATDSGRAAAIEEEASRARRAQRVADLTCSLLAQTGDLSLEEALRRVAGARREILALFPDKELVFDLLYRSRFLRILAERFHLSEDEILSFP